MVNYLIIIVMALFAVVPVMAQNAPDQIEAALEDLSTLVNRTVTLTQVDSWNYQQTVYASPALGCPQQGIAYADVQTSGFQFIITYGGTVYDYRVSEDGSIVVLCGTAPAPVTVPPCPPPDDPDFLPPRLSKDAEAQVVAGGLPNVLREQPGSSSQPLGQIPPEDSFIVLDGPRCTTLDKIVWWQINYNNLIGWTGEGQDGEYWLEPLTNGATPTPTAPTIQDITTGNANAVSQLYTADVDSPYILNTLDDTNLILGGADGSITLLDYRTNTVLSTVAAHDSAISSIAVGIDSLRFAYYVATGDQEGIIKIWNVDIQSLALEPLAEIAAHSGAVTSLTFDQRGAILASGGTDTSVRLWSMPDGGSLAVLNGHEAPITEIAFSTSALVSHDSNGKLMIWGIPTDIPAA
ncbi:MAG: SH3 domain-containing protein [Chloroflexi bacterium]|nr:SH3 domain-containing protein [Chloroflexota bacterium]MCC6894781.1 SH3 domain-containing protein [Anaerolineae bacterium]